MRGEGNHKIPASFAPENMEKTGAERVKYSLACQHEDAIPIKFVPYAQKCPTVLCTFAVALRKESVDRNNLWDAHRVKVYNKEFRAEHPEYFDPDGILVFCGPQGSGKTLSMIQYAYRLSLAYPDMIICTNVELHDWPPVREIIQWEGMKSLSEVENGFAGVLFLIDEIQLEFNSLESKQIDPSVMQEIAQQRKQRKHIVGTSQVFQRIAKPFREQFKYVVQCRKIMGVLQCNTVIDGQSAVVNDDGTIQAASVKTYHWIHKPSLYQLYDTYAKVLRVNEDRYGQQFWKR